MTKHLPFAGPVARKLAVLAGLSLAAVSLAHARGPEFPISVTEAQDQAEARFQEIDADGSGEISQDELANAPHGRIHAFRGHGRHMRHHRDGDHGRQADRGERLKIQGGKPEERNQEIFARLDANGDGLLSQDEFDPGELREARHEVMQERLFARLDEDASGGLSREEMPDPSRRLAAMDTDGDGLVTRQEARAHRQQRRDAHRADKG